MELSELFEQVSIVEYISQYIELEFRNGEYWGVSIFNPNEKTASFSVNDEKKCFKDFSSGLNGNVIDFILAYNKLILRNEISVREAFNILHKWLGTDNVIKKSNTLVGTVKKFRKKSVSSSVKNERKILNTNIFNKFVQKPIWEDEEIPFELIKKYNICVDEVHNNILIPIYDSNNNLISFSARTMVENFSDYGIPKYRYLFKIGTLDFFWGLTPEKMKEITKKKQVILVEGVKSVLKLESWGYTNAIAVLTSHINDHQVKILCKLGVDVIVAFDNNVDPREDECLKKVKRFCRVFYIKDSTGFLEEKDSPCDMGADVFKTIYKTKYIL